MTKLKVEKKKNFIFFGGGKQIILNPHVNFKHKMFKKISAAN